MTKREGKLHPPITEQRTLEEIVAVSLHSSHLETQPHESAIDRIGALGKGNRLGVLIFHFREGGIDEALAPAHRVFVRILAKRFGIRNVGVAGKRDYRTLNLLAFEVIEEWLNPGCPQCQGTGTVAVKRYEAQPEASVDEVCSLCKGERVYRHSDYERARALNMTGKAYYEKRKHGKPWVEMLELALAILRDRDEHTKKVMGQQLRGS